MSERDTERERVRDASFLLLRKLASIWGPRMIFYSGAKIITGSIFCINAFKYGEATIIAEAITLRLGFCQISIYLRCKCRCTKFDLISIKRNAIMRQNTVLFFHELSSKQAGNSHHRRPQLDFFSLFSFLEERERVSVTIISGLK